MLDPASFAAGERFRNDFTLAGLQPRVTSDWSNRVSGAALGDRGMHISDIMVGGAPAARRRSRRAGAWLAYPRRLRLSQRAGDSRDRAWLAGGAPPRSCSASRWRVSRAITDWPRRRAGRRGHARLGERRLPPENLS